MNIGILIYILFTGIVAAFASVLIGRYLYNRKQQISIDKIDFKNLPNSDVAKTTVALAYNGIIREDILKNSATRWDDDVYSRSFNSFLIPDNLQVIKSIRVEMLDVQY